MSLQGFIGTLIKGSGLDVLVGSAFGHVTIIMIGKAWVRSMRAFLMVAVVLLYNFLRDGEKTFNEISAYMDEVRKHPTGIQWVNFIKPTLSIHQFLHAEKEGD